MFTKNEGFPIGMKLLQLHSIWKAPYLRQGTAFWKLELMVSGFGVQASGFRVQGVGFRD